MVGCRLEVDVGGHLYSLNSLTYLLSAILCVLCCSSYNFFRTAINECVNVNAKFVELILQSILGIRESNKGFFRGLEVGVGFSKIAHFYIYILEHNFEVIN